MSKLQRILSNNLVVGVLGVLFFVEIVSLVFIEVRGVDFLNEEAIVNENVLISSAPLKISEIEGARIDEAAAMVVIDDSAQTETVQTTPFPRALFIFLFLTYLALLLFNFSYTFEKTVTPQWFWETLYTFLALLAWYELDTERSDTWFPLLIVKSGLITFALYLYLLEKKKCAQEEGASLV